MNKLRIILLKNRIIHDRISKQEGNMTLQDRLKRFRTQVAASPDALCEELNKKGFKISAPTVYGYEGGQRQPSIAYIKSLVEHFDANPLWLLQGQGEMFLNEDDKFKASLSQNLDLNNIVFIPVINMDVSAGYGSLAEEIEMTKDFISFGKTWLNNNINAPLDKLVVFRVKGDSMDNGNGLIKDGSLVIADTSITEYKNDGIYVLGIEGALFVKRLQYLPGKIRVKSDNPMYESFEINPNIDNVKIIGNVVYTISKVACV